MKNLNLRVYRRTQDNIALLWNKHALTEAQTKSITVCALGEGTSKPLSFITTNNMETVVEEGLIAPDDTEIMVISHEKNGLNAYEDCHVQISFGADSEKKVHDILVYGFGVLPPFEKDDKKLNEHSYGYDAVERKWVKFPLVRLHDGTYAVPVKLIKE